MASEAELVLLSNAVHNEKAPLGGWILDLSKPFGDIQINQYKNANGEVVDHYKGIKYLYINNLIGKYAKII